MIFVSRKSQVLESVLRWVSRRSRRSGKRKETHSSLGSERQITQKHVLILSQFYSPERSLYPTSIARAMADAGYLVSVVTGYPNRPGGKLYQGYKQRIRFSEEIEGIRVHRVPLVINHSASALARVCNFLTFSISALTVTGVAKKAHAVYVYATPATAAIPAQVWHKMLGIPYVLHVQDLWPESVTESGMIGQGVAKRLAEFVMTPWLKGLYKNADALITIAPSMRKHLAERGSHVGKIFSVFNWTREELVVVKPSNSFADKQLRLLYAGNLGPMQDLETVIEAARHLHDKEDFSLRIAGTGVLEEKLKASASGLSPIEFMGRLPRSEMSGLYLEADFQLVTLKDLAIFRATVPSKLQASLAAGVPVITTVAGDVANLIQTYEAGLVAEPESVDSLVAAFKRASKMSTEDRARMGRNARRLYEEQMSYAAGTAAIRKIIDKVSGRVSPDAP